MSVSVWLDSAAVAPTSVVTVRASNSNAKVAVLLGSSVVELTTSNTTAEFTLQARQPTPPYPHALMHAPAPTCTIA